MTRYCIMSHNRSLPDNLDRFERMICQNSGLSEDDRYATDVDWLLALADGLYDTIWWTAPADFEPGGVLLIYLRELPSRSMGAGLMEKVMGRMNSFDTQLVPNLFHAEVLARTYGGTIFAAARVGSVAEEFEDRRGCAEHSVVLNSVCVFEVPLPVREFADIVEVGDGLFTNLDQERFVEVRSRFAERNALPEFLELA